MSSIRGWAAAGALALAAGCAHGGAKVEAGRSAPKAAELAERYGCTGAVQSSARSSRRTTVRPGMPMCDALQQFGNPLSVSSSEVSGMKMVSMLHRPGSQYVSVVYVYYEDTPQNREIKRPIGRWIVQSVRYGR